MSNTSIQLKKSGITGNTPADLILGEVAINYADGKLYYKDAIDDIKYINNQDSFATINVNSTLVLAASPTDTLSLTNTNDITLTTNTTTKTITIGSNSVAGSYANSAYTHANAAFDLANTISGGSVDVLARDIANAAFIQANAAFAYANTMSPQDNVARDTANSAALYANGAFIQANAAYDTANSSSLYANSAFLAANTPSDVANSAALYANSSFVQANAAFLQANTPSDVANSAALYANGAFIQSNSAYDTANTAGSYANSSFVQSNSAYDQANSAGLYANAAFLQANTPSDVANSAASYANSAFLAANTADGKSVTSGSYANSAFDTANSAGSYANSAFSYANSAYTRANNSVNANSGGTITGDITINANLIVTGANVALGNVGNVHIYGGNTGQLLTTDNNGNLNWIDLPTPNTVTYTANSLIQTNGVYVSGNLWSTQIFGDYLSSNGAYVLTDGSGSAPAWYINFDFIDVVKFNRVVLNINYTQASGHTIYVQLYNNLSSTWDNIGTYTGLGSYYAFALEVIDETNYVNAGIVQLRLYHSNGGNVSHQTSIDYVALEQSFQGPQGPRGPTGLTGTTGATGNGVASGGSTGQVLIKNSATNYDTTWSNNLIDAWNTGNSAFIQANAAFLVANTPDAIANSSALYANGAFVQANAAYQSQNTTGTYANSAFTFANSAGSYANSAFTKANNALPLTGGTINGSLDITQNLSVTGNLTVLGTSTSINTLSFTVQDTMLLLGLGNYTSDILDIGFASHYNDGQNAHTGIFRDASEKQWMFFEGYTPEISPNNDIIITDASFRYANVRARDITGNLIANTVTINGYNVFSYITNAYTQANTPSNVANSAALYANGAFLQANAAFITANTPTHVANSAALYANGAFTAANTADSKAVSAGSYANSAFLVANTPTHVANSAALYANGAFIQANAAFIRANTPDAIANSAALYANGAFIQANAAFLQANTPDYVANSAALYANGAFIQANAAFIQANTPPAVANSAAIYANGAFVQANAAFTKANNSVQTGFTTFAANGVNVTPATSTDTITITPGTGITISACTTTKTITFSSSGGGGGAVTFAATPPASGNTAGDRWIDSSDGTEYTWVTDGTSYQWVDFTSPTVNTYSILGGSAGAIPYQLAASNTAFLNAGTAGQILSITSGATPIWVSQSSFSIANSQITGVMTASQLAATAVTPATYGGATNIPVIVVDQQGRITSAANITPSIANSQITGVMIASQLAATAVTPATYGGSTNIPVITVDQQGRLTSAANIAVTSGTTIVDDTASAVSLYPIFTTATSGSISTANVTSTKLTFVPSTGTLSSTVVTATSDENLKNNIVTITNAVDTVKKLRGVEYDWRDNGNHSMGLVAQELEKVLPYLVHENENVKSVMYSNMIGLLIEAIKEQQIQIDELKGKINGND